MFNLLKLFFLMCIWQDFMTARPNPLHLNKKEIPQKLERLAGLALTLSRYAQMAWKTVGLLVFHWFSMDFKIDFLIESCVFSNIFLHHNKD